MTATVRRGADLFDSAADAITVTVNCVGVMGKGIALTAKERDPELLRQYQTLCQTGQLRLGAPALIRRLVPPSYVLFPTKHHWRDRSNVASILAGIDRISEAQREWQLTSLALPPLGCGYGGLEWAIVAPLYLERLGSLDLHLEVYPPAGATESLDARLVSVEELEAARKSVPPASMAVLSLLGDLHHSVEPVGQPELQWLWYLAQVAGVVSGWEYEEGRQGPVCAALRKHILELARNGLLSSAVGSHPGTAYYRGPAYAGYAGHLQPDLSGLADRLTGLAAALRRLSRQHLRLVVYLHWLATTRAVRDAGRVAELLRSTRWPGVSRFSDTRIAHCLDWMARLTWIEPRQRPAVAAESAADGT